SEEAEPQVLYTSSIHGDEVTGYVLMLRFIDYLLSHYGNDTEITDLLDHLEIWICPLANPDGTFHDGNNSVNGATRANAHGVDLNRNFKDFVYGDHPDDESWQVETESFMEFQAEHDFVLGINIHGGTEVLNYPWDNNPTLHADDDWWQFICREYVDTVHLYSSDNYMTELN
ncbi:MAG: M14 family zinc carboxypeptidase, partial [Bacteroidales bacterium]|nr:M14 family zinc carboxypeptidase [Bacteroidales bacterium]